ncbi:MAG: hypothetical protein RL754_568 [Bacteroidota bacterium]|jgi:HAD superfamily hydrolase (TIGR01509 family)
MMVLPKLVAFDMDGTLIDNYEFHLKAWGAVCEELGQPRTREAIVRDLHGTNLEICRTFFDANMSEEEANAIGDRKEAMYRELYQPHIKPVEGLHRLLDQFSDFNIPMALGTMGNRENAEFVIDLLNLEPYFRAVFTAEDVQRGKPHPDIFNKCFDALSNGQALETKEKWVFEDTSSGIQSAVNASATAIGVLTSKSSEELLKHGASWTIKTYDEVLKTFKID